MKKTLAFILATVFVFALFSGCDKKTAETPPGGSAAVSSSVSDTPSTPEATEPAEDSPYNFAKGKFEVNEKGYPAAPYEYTLPISTTDEVLTYWTSTLSAQYIPEEGFGSMEYPMGLNALTGVNIEYQMIAFAEMATIFSTLLAADDLPDMMNFAISYYPGSFHKAIDEGFLIDIYDYKDYCPNYIYQATFDPSDKNTFEYIFFDTDSIIAFYNMSDESTAPVGKVIRGDYLERVGMTNADLVTWDDWFNALSLIKSQIEICEYPWPLTNFIDGDITSCSFDTRVSVAATAMPPNYVKDGKVCFGNMTERDLAFMQKMNEFYSAGLIDPNWASYGNSYAFQDKYMKGETAMMDMAESEPGPASESNEDPNCRWVPLKKPLLQAGQVLHLGSTLTRMGYGNTSISAKCENIELAVSWCDFSYSPTGSFYCSYGPEGLLWEYDSEGEVTLTEFCIKHELGIGWIMMLYAQSNIMEHGLVDSTRKARYPGGELVFEVRAYWADYAYDGSMEYPIGARLTDEESSYVNSLSNDITTYISENFSLFLDGSKPFSEWDSYVEGLYGLNIQKVFDPYLAAYERYLSSS
jgi:putative aldouronate transport system substrate-binding protein